MKFRTNLTTLTRLTIEHVAPAAQTAWHWVCKHTLLVLRRAMVLCKTKVIPIVKSEANSIAKDLSLLMGKVVRFGVYAGILASIIPIVTPYAGAIWRATAMVLLIKIGAALILPDEE